MIRLWEKYLFHVLMLGLVLYFVISALNFSRRDLSALPLLVGIPLIILIFLIFLGDIFPSFLKLFESSLSKLMVKDNKNPAISFDQMEEGTVIDNRRLSVFSLWLIVFGISSYYIGFFITVPLLSFVYGFFIVRFNWWRSLVTTLIPSVLLLLMWYFMRDSIFSGVLFGGWVPKI